MAYLKGTLEHVDEQLVGDDIQFLLILSLNIGLSNCFTPNRRRTSLITKSKLRLFLDCKHVLHSKLSNSSIASYWRHFLLGVVTLKVKLT